MLRVAGVAAQTRTSTTYTSIGLFYQPNAPQITVLRKAGDDGEPLNLRGRVLSIGEDLSEGALVELWHANALGGVDGLARKRYRVGLSG